jgi:uncharacterized RDD family membrane protein YckC
MTSTANSLPSANPYAPPRASVRDIRDPHVVTELADRGTRLAAAMLDTLIVGAMVYLPIIVGSLFVSSENETALVAGIGLAFVGFVVWAWLTVLNVLRNGQSIGKKMLDIRVVRSDGSAISLGRWFWLRNFVNGVLGMIPLYSFIEVLFIFGESRQCLHDKIADTIVIKG